MRHYITLIHQSTHSDLGVSFPDPPGCVTAGATLDEAHAFAEEALALHLAGMAEEAELIPDASSLDVIMDDPQNRDGVAALIPVRAKGEPARSIRVNITLPEDVLIAIDAHAEANGMNRSGFLAYAAKKEIGRAA